MKQREPGRREPIRPETIDWVPIVTIEKLATALAWIGRSAIRR